MMEITFWGVRGAIPSPGPDTVKYGGNTSCVELYIRAPHRRIIIDAGSGIRNLGSHLMSPECRQKPFDMDLFFTHTHSDHIIGFPFFAPLYVPGTKLRIYGPATYYEGSLERVISSQMSYHFFPVRVAELAAEMSYHELKEGCHELGDGIQVTTRYLNHPLMCFGYRFEHGGQVFCTVFDTEPYRNLFARDPDRPFHDDSIILEGESAAAEENNRLEQFFKGADLLIYDAQYLQQEYDSSRVGWGHSPIEYVIASARRAQVKRLALFHHDPERTDAQIDAFASVYCKPEQGESMEIFFALEGMKIEI